MSMIENPGFSYTTVQDVIRTRSLSNIKVTMGIKNKKHSVRLGLRTAVATRPGNVRSAVTAAGTAHCTNTCL